MSSSTMCGGKSRGRVARLSFIPSAASVTVYASRATSQRLERSPRHAAKHSLAIDALEYAGPERGFARLWDLSLRLVGAGALSTGGPVPVVGAPRVGTGPADGGPAGGAV